MTPEEEARVNLYMNIFVDRRSLGKILDQHGDRVVKQLKPELENIDRRLTEGYTTFKEQEKDIEDIKIHCAQQHGPNPGTPGQLPQTPPIQSSEIITTEGVNKKTAVILAIVTGVIMVTSVLVAGAVYLITKFPF